ncbi:dihydrofolate reductase family protein [Leifsonia sp. Root112D2]|uniref:dihydrofolate reductase family protein n=1 Tax=Leifsonia sp. Root112D2 TaxID=1736426 RepID=UPI0006FE46A7|nr:dihydrofolate reductase family protein [Leifsonia sp. Root112D2]KQV06850.1 deaminase [Leifsonia sp. Root112D2]
MKPHLPFEGCVFLGLSVDDFIARPDGDLSWLISRGEAAGDAGFTPFMQSVDALVMGRGTYEAIAHQPEWPYLGRPVHVLSSSLAADVDERITVHSTFTVAVQALSDAGYRRVYVDGGQTTRAFLEAGLITELTLSRVPVLIGRGVPLFGPLSADIALEHIRTNVLAGGMVQTTYRVLSAPLS